MKNKKTSSRFGITAMRCQVALCPLVAAGFATAVFGQNVAGTQQPVKSRSDADGEQAANAASNPPKMDSSSKGLGEIVVTAQRRSENLQNVPIAVTAVGAAQLDRTGVARVTDLSLSVAGLTIQETAGYSTPHLRGVGSNALGPGVENPIATYIDGVYIASASQALFSFNNVSQVEVLKGPQGTLFGRNATGGLIQVTTRDPTQAFGADGSLTYGNYNMVQGSLYLTGGVADNLAADIAVQGMHQGDGWGRNLTTGHDVYSIPHEISLRSKWVWQPGPDTKITAIGDYLNRSTTMLGYGVSPGTTSILTPGVVYNNKGWDVQTDKDNYNKGWAWGGSLRIDQTFDAFKIMSLTAYRRSRFDYGLDLDYTPVNAQTVDARQRDRQLSEELQISSPNSADRFKWVAGLFYFDAAGRYDPSLVGLNEFGITIHTQSEQTTKSVAGYVQGTYELFDRTNITVGGRYTHEERRLFGTNLTYVYNTNIQLGPPDSVNNSVAFNKFTFRIAVDRHFSDSVMGYISFDRGFKGGGYNAGALHDAPYRPEQLDAWEVGIKSTLFDRRLRLNVSGFYYDYKDLQVSLVELGSVGVINGAKARIYGADIDVTAVLTDHLRLSGSAELMDNEFLSFPQAPLTSLTGGIPVTGASAKGHEIPYAVSNSANLSLDYSRNLTIGKIDANVSGEYSSGWYPLADNLLHQRPFVRLNSSVKWTSINNRIWVSVWGKNLTSKRVDSFTNFIANGDLNTIWAAPRTYGGTIGFHF